MVKVFARLILFHSHFHIPVSTITVFCFVLFLATAGFAQALLLTGNSQVIPETALGNHIYLVVGIKLKTAVCKAKVLPTVLSLWTLFIKNSLEVSC